MLLREKFLSTGGFEKLKARLVAGGNTQHRSTDDERNFTALTIFLGSINIMAAIAARE
jgi:hypothetical protein